MLRAANPYDNPTPPMHILGHVAVPLFFEGDDTVREIPVRVVDGLPYGMIIGAEYFKRNQSALDFLPFRGFQPEPGAPWVPFANMPMKQVYGLERLESTAALWDTYQKINTTPASAEPCVELPTHSEVAWEDESSLEWDVRQVSASIHVKGFTSVALEAAAVGVQPQDRQLVMVLPSEKYDLSSGAKVGIARSAMWWTPGAPVYSM